MTGKGNDNSMAKRARKLAEESVGQKNTILKHVQTGLFAAPKGAPKERARKYSFLLDLTTLFFLFLYCI